MGQIHKELIVKCRRELLAKRFKERKSPTPDFHPDFYGIRYSRSGDILEEIMVEAEIESTLYSEHTSDQLVKMDDYILHQGRKKIKVRGYLLVPKGKNILALANSLLESMFVDVIRIRVIQR